jgi:hypothetical protein
MKRFYILRVLAVVLQVFGWVAVIGAIAFVAMNWNGGSADNFLPSDGTSSTNTYYTIKYWFAPFAFVYLLIGLVTATVGHIASAVVYIARRDTPASS